MISFAINLTSTLLSINKPMKLTIGNAEALKCRIVELSEQQNFQLPQFPVDRAEYRSDTIYREPLSVTARVYVKANDIEAFLTAIHKAQFRQELFTIFSLYNQQYASLKIVSYARDTNASVLNATHYNIQFQEVIMVQALTQDYKSQKNSGYASQKHNGNQAPEPQKKSALLEGSNALGFLR